MQLVNQDSFLQIQQSMQNYLGVAVKVGGVGHEVQRGMGHWLAGMTGQCDAVLMMALEPFL